MVKHDVHSVYERGSHYICRFTPHYRFKYLFCSSFHHSSVRSRDFLAGTRPDLGLPLTSGNFPFRKIPILRPGPGGALYRISENQWGSRIPPMPVHIIMLGFIKQTRISLKFEMQSHTLHMHAHDWHFPSIKWGVGGDTLIIIHEQQEP